jgi:deazaflavin-dependent oxidoreductase (nitroreductase family)
VRDETVRIGREFGSVTLWPMPSDFALKAMNRVHRILLGVSGGRFGWHFSGMPVIELTTTGRKSGQPRTTMLTSPYQEDSTIVVVASRGGDDTNPAWFLNLRDDPNVMVKLGPKPAEPMVAEIADANERARIWPTIASKHTNYAGYQRKTDRQIPLVLLRPAAG